MSEEPVDYVYVAKKTCGCVGAIAVDKPEYRKHTAREVASWIQDGYTVERMPREAGVEAMCRKCTHEGAKQLSIPFPSGKEKRACH